MFGFCHFGNWGSLGNVGAWGGIGNVSVWGWIGFILNLVLWVGLLALLVIWVMRRSRVSAATATYATGQPTAKEILQSRYARGEITHEQYERMKQDIG